MESDGAALKRRLNGALLPEYQGQNVCLLGLAANVDRTGQSFQLTTSDNQTVLIRLQDPLQEVLQGLVEVHGSVTGRAEVMCYNFVVYPEDSQNSFDIDAYDKMVVLLHKFPELYLPPNYASSN